MDSDKYLLNLRKRLINHSEDKGSCRIWTGKSKGFFGYGFLNYRGKRRAAHRVSWIAWKGEIPEGKFVLHSCDVPACINPDHLFIGDARDNAHDMIKKGRNYIPKGEDQWQAKLKEYEVIEIRRLYHQEKITVKEICNIFNITKGSINPLLRRKTWKHVE